MSETYMDLHEKLSRLQWLMQRKHLQSHARRGPAADPSRGQGRVLAMLKMQPEISTRDLSYLLGIRQQSLNELLHKLEKAGYVTRTPSQADKRIMLVRITEKGQAAQSDAPDHSDLFSYLSPQEQASFGEYLDRVIAALEAEIGLDEEDDERETWMHDFRHRMGDERFEMLFATGGHRHPHGPGCDHPHRRGMRGGFGARYPHAEFHRHGEGGSEAPPHGYPRERQAPPPEDE